MTAQDASTRGRRNRTKGAVFERAIVTAIRPYFPDARRSRDNGSANTSDTGDIADTGPALFWSLKDDSHGLTSAPSVISAWWDEAALKAQGRMPLIVQKRRGIGEPLLSWCWLSLVDLQLFLGQVPSYTPRSNCLVRMELRDVLAVMAFSNHARTPSGVAS